MQQQKAGDDCIMKRFMICTSHQTEYSSGDQVIKHEMGRVCGTHGKAKNAHKVLVGKSEVNAKNSMGGRRLAESG